MQFEMSKLICYKDLGIFGHCENIHTNLKADITGIHKFVFFFNGFYYYHYQELIKDQEIIINSGILNERTTVYMKIYKPDNSEYSGITMDNIQLNETMFLFKVEIINTI